MTDTRELEPCPFCGGEARFEATDFPHEGWGAVACQQCCASGDDNARVKAIAAWNTRATPKAVSGEVERLLAITAEAAFLCDRIDQLDWCESLEETARQHAGHVDPSHSRLKRLLAALSPVDTDNGGEALGRFGHHPDARTDYECEIDALIGVAYERLTMGGHDDLEDRIARAMDFRTISKPGELRWLNQTFRGVREIYAKKPDWMQWPEERLAAYTPKPASDNIGGAVPEDVLRNFAREARRLGLRPDNDCYSFANTGLSNRDIRLIANALAASPSPQGKPSLDGESGK